MNKVLDFPAPDKTAKGNPIITHWLGTPLAGVSPRRLHMMLSDADALLKNNHTTYEEVHMFHIAAIWRADERKRQLKRQVWWACGFGFALGAGTVIAAHKIWGV